MDGGVLVLAVAAAILFTLLAGIVPAFTLPARGVEPVLRASRTATAFRGQQRLWSGFIAAQLALTLVLAFACGLLVRSFIAVLDVDLGYQYDDVVVADISLPQPAYADHDRRLSYWEQALERVRSIPGVRAGLTNHLPTAITARVSGTYKPGDEERWTFGGFRTVDRGYFDAIGIPVLSGDLDNWQGRPDAVLIGSAIAERFWPTGDAIGDRVYNGNFAEPLRIAGVVGSVREWNVPASSFGAVYVDYRLHADELSDMHLVVRAADATSIAASVRAALAEVDPLVPITLAPLAVRVAEATAGRRLLLTIALAFMAVAMLLAAIGVHAIVAFVVARRRREAGIRLALGAPVTSVLRAVLGHGLRPASIGLIVGALLVVPAGRALEAQLFQVQPFDPIVLAVCLAVLTCAAYLAAWLPARRVMRVDPVSVMRDE